MRPRKDHIHLAGGRIETLWWEQPRTTGPTLVFLHEGLGSAGLWRDFPSRLAAATGLDAFAFSRFGYGGSDPCALPRPLDYLTREAVEILPEVLSAAAISDFILVGHSDGATIALLYAGLAAAPGFRGGIVEAPHVLVEEVTVAGIRATRDLYDRGLRDRLARHHGANVDIAFEGWWRTWLDPEFRAWNVESELAGIARPFLVIQGRDDEYATLAQVERVAASHPDLMRTLVVEACGHTPHRDQAELVLAAMVKFVQKLLN